MNTVPSAVLARWRHLADAPSRPFGTGLINDTFLVEGRAGRAVVQRLHPVFSPRVHDDIAAVTARLAARGVLTPTLLPADDGARWVEHPREDGAAGVWRAMTYVPDSVAHDKVTGAPMAFEAGALVGAFHAALEGIDHAWQGRKGTGHDTARHVATLRAALDAHRGHRLYDRVAPLAEAVLAALDPLPDFEALPVRACHGDLKISNLLFTPEGRGLCLVDLDTVGPMRLPHELGDALRSWCNPAGEDAAEVAFDGAVFERAVEGWASRAGSMATRDEWGALVTGTITVCRELAARFLADALNERYFGWDPARHATRGEHNLARGAGQWRLSQSAEAQRGALEAAVRRVAEL